MMGCCGVSFEHSDGHGVYEGDIVILVLSDKKRTPND